MKYPSIQIAVLNYNGRDLLAECIPSVIKAASKYRGKCRISVIDNKSTDKSAELVRKKFKKVSLYDAPENKVLVSYNSFIKNVKEDITIILNNDMKLDPGFIEPLIKYFNDSKTFFVSPKHMSFDAKEYQGGKNKLEIKLGFPATTPFYNNYQKGINISSKNLYTGNGAFRTKIFNRLGGFDSLYLPGGMENVDLCYRALKSGYKGYYEPKSVLYHKGSASFNKEFSKKKIKINNYRNAFLFGWKNFQGFYLFKQIIKLFIALPVFLLTGRFYHLAGFFAALIKTGSIKRPQFTISDKKVISEVNRPRPLPVYDETEITKRLSIVIPSHNRIKQLKTLLNSLLKQKYLKNDVEIIISDDGSTDSTEKGIKKLMKKYKELKYIKQENSGPAAARNAGIRAARGKYIGLIDSDVIADKNLIKNALDAFRKNSKADGIEGATYKKILDVPESMFTHSAENTKGGRWLTCNLFLTKKILHSINGFDENYKAPIREDTDIGFTLVKHKAKIIFDKNIAIYHPVYKSSWKQLFKLAYYGVYEALLIKKYPEYYFKHLKWTDSWAFPIYYAGYYTLPVFLAVYYYISSPWLLISGIVFFALSHLISIYALCRKKKPFINELITAFILMLFIPYLRFYWVCYGIIKYWIFKK